MSLGIELETEDTPRCLCGSVRLGDSVAHREDGCRPFVAQRGSQGAQEAYPAPVVTSREFWDGSGCPAVVLAHAERARAASWDVRVQRSRGHAPHAAHGAPGALKWRHALVLGNGVWSAYAVYVETTWASVMLWGRTRPWFPYASISDLAEYISARGQMDDAWYAAIIGRERGKTERAREQARLRAQKTKSGSGEAL